MATIREEILDFTHEKKAARFTLVVSGEVYTDNEEIETEEVRAEIPYILVEGKDGISLRIMGEERNHEVPLVVDRISGSIVIFFRAETRFPWDQRVYINIITGWFGKWKHISFADANNRQYFRQAL